MPKQSPPSQNRDAGHPLYGRLNEVCATRLQDSDCPSNGFSPSTHASSLWKPQIRVPHVSLLRHGTELPKPITLPAEPQILAIVVAVARPYCLPFRREAEESAAVVALARSAFAQCSKLTAQSSLPTALTENRRTSPGKENAPTPNKTPPQPGAEQPKGIGQARSSSRTPRATQSMQSEANTPTAFSKAPI